MLRAAANGKDEFSAFGAYVNLVPGKDFLR